MSEQTIPAVPPNLTSEGVDEPPPAAARQDEPARAHLHEEVERQLVRLIERGELARAAKLPTELELAARFGVSRPIVRRALEKLREAGYVTTRKGSGTVVVGGRVPSQPRFPALASVADLQQFYEFRMALEGQIAAQAAERRTERDLDAIALATGRAGKALLEGSFELSTDLNFAFHRAVAAASANRFFMATLEALPNLVGETALRRRFGPLDEERVRQERLLREHEAIAEAILARDAPRARSLMNEHIAAAMRFVFENTGIDLAGAR